MIVKNILCGVVIGGLLASCASVKNVDRCTTYTMSGDLGVAWAPTKFYQSESMLFMQLSKSTKEIPTVRVMDQEFDQPYKIEYKYHTQTSRLEVADNYDEYILTRTAYDELSEDNVYIRCNRTILK